MKVRTLSQALTRLRKLNFSTGQTLNATSTNKAG